MPAGNMLQACPSISGPLKWRSAPIALIGLTLMASAPALGDGWSHYAGDVSRSAAAPDAPTDLSAILWVAAQDPAGNPIAFEGPSSPVIWNGRVYVNARHLEDSIYVANKLVALDEASGQWLWEALVEKPAFEFWSAPAVDVVNEAVLLGTGDKLYSIDATTGALNWAAQLDRIVVNASPAVPATLNPGRAFITDYDGFGASASSYCINTSPFSAIDNPYQLGDIIWQEPIGGSSGNTPAYDDGVVFVASSRGVSDSSGHIYAFDVDAPAGERLLWQWSLPNNEGFFGGIVYHDGSVYAASYDFNGGGDNSTLVKIRATDGVLQWTVPCERTDSMPIVSENMVYLSAGIPGFGSAPKVQAFQDHGTFAIKTWDTFVDTAGGLIAGGWTHQPVLRGDVLYVGRIPDNPLSFGAYTDLFLLDTTKSPADPGFVLDQLSGTGSSPAVSGGRIYSIGPEGLYAIATRGDYCGGDGQVNGRDVRCFVDALLSEDPTLSEIALGDFDVDNELTTADIPGFLDELLGP